MSACLRRHYAGLRSIWPPYGRISDGFTIRPASTPQIMTLVKADAYGPGLKQITVSQVAKWCDTIPWEILTRISTRVPRVYLGGHAA